MTPSLLLTPLLFFSVISANQFPPQQPLSHQENHDNGEFRIAIIGAGIAGASAAFHLRNLSTSGFFHGKSVSITVIESSDEIGGQVKTVSPPGYQGDRFRPLELGASFFFEDDWCLIDVARGTQTALSQSRENRRTNDGRYILKNGRLIQDRFCETATLGPHFWTWREAKSAMKRMLDWVRFEWTHGFLPSRVSHSFELNLERFKNFGRNGTFDNVMQELERCSLGHEVSSRTASDFLNDTGMDQDLQKTFLEPCIQEAYGLSLDEALGLHAVLSAGAIRPNLSVVATRGNQRMIEGMIEKSGAQLRLKSRVVRLEAGIDRRYLLTRSYAWDGEEQEHSEYDAIIATGDALRNLQFSGSNASPRRHITTFKSYFSTTDRIDADGIGLKTGVVPRSVLFARDLETSGPKSDMSLLNLTSLTTWPEFYKDSTSCTGDDECDQFVDTYIADSTTALPKEDLSRLTGGHEPISWSQTRSWKRNVPVANGTQPSFGDIEVEAFLFDTSNGVLDSMEMSCRMGRNVALKIAKQLLDAIQYLDDSGGWKGQPDLLENIVGES